LTFLRERNAEVRLDHELRALRFAEGRIAALDFGAETVTLGPDDAVILAVPHHAAAALVPDLRSRRVIAPSPTPISASRCRRSLPPMLGIINGTTEWIFAFAGRLSVTISNADRLMDVPAGDAGSDSLAGGVSGDGNCSRAAAVADRPRAAGDLRGHSGGKRQASRCADALGQSRSRRRLDRDRDCRRRWRAPCGPAIARRRSS
jgi:hypothetical protein